MIKVAIAGATGYTGGELIRILLNHPDVELKWLISTTSVGESVSSLHRDLTGECNLSFTDGMGDPEVLFLAFGRLFQKISLQKSQESVRLLILEMISDWMGSGERSSLFMDYLSCYTKRSPELDLLQIPAVLQLQ
ncbi:hypothetical protein MASR1M46_17620 [Bacteroidales bacterium]